MDEEIQGAIQAQETKASAKEIEQFLHENANSIDSSVQAIVQQDFSFIQKYVTKRGLVRLVDEIKTKQIKNVAQFYSLIYKIESDGKLTTAAELVQLKTSRLRTEFQEQFRKFADHKLVVLGQDTENTRSKINEQIEKGFSDIEKYKDNGALYSRNVTSLIMQMNISFEIIDANYEKFKNIVIAEAKKYSLDK